MRGDDSQPESMLSWVSAEQRIPADHPLCEGRLLAGRGAESALIVT
jgi:hypothetical protein